MNYVLKLVFSTRTVNSLLIFSSKRPIRVFGFGNYIFFFQKFRILNKNFFNLFFKNIFPTLLLPIINHKTP